MRRLRWRVFGLRDDASRTFYRRATDNRRRHAHGRRCLHEAAAPSPLAPPRLSGGDAAPPFFHFCARSQSRAGSESTRWRAPPPSDVQRGCQKTSARLQERRSVASARIVENKLRGAFFCSIARRCLSARAAQKKKNALSEERRDCRCARARASRRVVAQRVKAADREGKRKNARAFVAIRATIGERARARAFGIQLENTNARACAPKNERAQCGHAAAHQCARALKSDGGGRCSKRRSHYS